MELTYHGNSCFTIKDKKRSIVINPDEQAGKRQGDVVLSSLSTPPRKVEDATEVFDWPGEYEIKGVPILGFQAWSEDSKEDEAPKGDETIIFYFEIGKFKVCHLGRLGHVLKSEVINKIGDVDILMIDASDSSNLDIKKAMDIVETIDPRVIVPMGEGNSEAFLKELGAENVESEKKFAVKVVSNLPTDGRQHVILEKT